MDVETLSSGLNGFGHPVRLRCLVLLEAERSPSELSEILADTKEAPALGVVSYHVRMLRQYGLVTEVRAEPRRGALEHFYQRTELAEQMIKVIGPMVGKAGVPKRGPGRPTNNGARTMQLLKAMEAPKPRKLKTAA